MADLPNAEASYPGKGADGVAPPSRLGADWVDSVGLDQYDSSQRFDRPREQLDRTLDMARKYGKAFSVPEWGVWSGGADKLNESGFGDRPSFVGFMVDWLNTGPARAGVPLLYHSYFNQPPPFPSSLDRNPKSQAEFIERFRARAGDTR